MLDATSNEAFIRDKITKGIIVGDKGFPESAAHEEFERHPDLHYLNPVKRNSKLIGRHHMLDFTDILSGYEGITYRKEKCVGTDKWLYSYRNSRKAAKEESDRLRRAKKEKPTVWRPSRETEDRSAPSSWSVTWISLRRLHTKRMTNAGKSNSSCDTTNLHANSTKHGCRMTTQLSAVSSVISRSTLLTFRLINAFDKAGLLEEYTHKKISLQF